MARVCHLTVLNPALHSRIYFKEALSQAAAGYEVSVIGQDAAAEPYVRDGVRIVPTGVFGRMGRRRVFAKQYLLPLAEAERADVYQIHSPELLRVGRELKLARPEVKVIYDVHEDYAANVRAGSHFPEWSKKPLLSWLRREERAFGRWGDGLVYAEECYAGLLDFDAAYTAVVQNKFKAPAAPSDHSPATNRPYLLYTGTIAEAWGIFRTLDLWEALNQVRPMDLVVAGHTHNAALVEELQLVAEGCDVRGRMHILGGKEYLPYEYIVELIRGCWAGTALYTVAPHIAQKHPTKFFEFMACGKPLFFSANPHWENLNQNHAFGMPIGGEPEPDQLRKMVERIDQGEFGEGKIPEEVWAWKTEEQALLELLEKVLG